VTLTGLLLAAFVAPTGIPGSLATADAKVSRIDVERANGRPLAPLPVSSTRPAVAKRWGFQTAVLLGYLGSRDRSAPTKPSNLAVAAATRARPPPPRPTDPASVFIAPSGSDAKACTRRAPCASFNRAYAVAALGDVVEMSCGTYPAQTITEKSGKDRPGDLPDVVFRPAKGCPTVRVVDLTLGTYVNGNGPDHITLRGLSDVAVRGNQSGWNFGWDTTDVTVVRFDTGSVYLDGTNGVTLRKGDLGPCDREHPAGSDCSNNKLGLDNANTLIDGVTFHEYYCDPSNCHFECLIVFGARGITVRNSKFYLCDVYDIFFQGDRGLVRNVTLENNWFDQPLSPNIANGRRNPSYGRNSSVEFSRVGYSRVLIRFNSFHPRGGITFDCCTQTTFRVVGNIMRFGACASGVTYAYNVQVGGRCSRTDVNASSPRYVHGNHLQNGGDFHLAGGVAVGRVRAKTSDYLLARDIDGQKRPRGVTRDAGSDER
jgi:hypothetical protein